MQRYKDLIVAALADHCRSVPAPLGDAMRHILLGDGHHIRPMLVLAWCDACGGRVEDALPVAVAVELVHTMSLIHDDLPCMDNADTRRGQPACHRVYGEATALLTGDALLADSFGVVARSGLPDGQALRGISVLSAAASRMADGQAAELRGGDWVRVYTGKTAALLEAACVLGVIAAGGSSGAETAAAAYGHNLGMAYQFLDDIRDGDGVINTMGRDRALELARGYLDGCKVEGDTPAHRALRALVREVVA